MPITDPARMRRIHNQVTANVRRLGVTGSFSGLDPSDLSYYRQNFDEFARSGNVNAPGVQEIRTALSGGRFDPQTGFPLGLDQPPSAHLALQYQFLAERFAEQQRRGFFRDAERGLLQGTNVFESFRPGGASGLLAGIYGQRANLLFATGQEIQAPDLLSDYRRDEAFQARRRARRAGRLSFLGGLVQAAGSAAGMALTAGAGTGLEAAGAGQAAASQQPLTPLSSPLPQGQAAGPGGAPGLGQMEFAGGGQAAGAAPGGPQPFQQRVQGPSGQAAPAGGPAPGAPPGAPPGGPQERPGGPGAPPGGGPQPLSSAAMGPSGYGLDGNFSNTALASAAMSQLSGAPGTPATDFMLKVAADEVDDDPFYEALEFAVEEILARQVTQMAVGA